MSAAQGNTLRAALVAVVCVLAALAAGLQVFASSGLGAAGHVALALCVVAATLWISEALPLFVTSLLVLLGCLTWLAPSLRGAGRAIDDAAFLAPFFSDTILLFFGGFALSAALQRVHLDEALARAILERAGTSPRRVVFALLGTTAFLSMWLSNTATAAMMMALAVPIARTLPPENRWRIALLLAVPLGANLGGLGTPIGSPPNAIAMEALARIDARPSFLAWMALGIPGVLVMCTLAGGLLVRFYRDGEPELRLPPAPAAATHRTARARLTLLVASATALLWLTGDLHGWSAGTVGLACAISLFGSGLLAPTELRALPWEVLLLMGGGLCLGRAVELSGLASWALAQTPIATLGPTGAVVLFGGAAALLSALMSNTAAANLVLAVVLGLEELPREPILVAVAFACSLSMPLPVSTPPNAMAFASGEVSARDLVKIGTATTVLGLLLFFTTAPLWWRLIGPLFRAAS
ncbi:MAG: DASS family sodium-coupled anion symporter [Planctomycetes bacterium]|nr:DASS family sodium-coupled anion symporter [Planctomycetota bacterium]